VVGDSGTVVAPDDTIFAELANRWPTSVGYHDILLRPRLPKARRVRGRVLTLAASMGDNYYHWMTEIVPRIRLVEEELSRADHIVVQSALPFQRECLEAAGVPLDRVVPPVRRMHLLADELVVPSLVPGVRRESVEYMQRLFRAQRSTGKPRRRLYATRSNAWRRRVVNEPELEGALAPLGFETVAMEGLSVGEQAALFSEAEVVVAPHGGQLTNLLFAQPGVVLIELWDANYVRPAYWELTAAVGGTYHYFVNDSPAAGSQWRDIQVSVKDVLAALAVHGVG
jgi:capsular polysaccharide biosynthesis protein